MSTKESAIARLTCFLLGHDLRHYRLVCRNQTRLVCRRCHHPYGDTLADVCQRLLQRSKTRRKNPDELPF